jgi:hypothetical protein
VSQLGRVGVLAVPLVGVNAIAMYGQAAWFAEHASVPVPAAAAVAAVLESIAVYLAYEAHRALLAGDSSLRLRAASYAAGAAFGLLNYDHYMPDAGRAALFGGLSALSPWLWAIRSRSLRRDDLRARGLVDSRAAHFAAARWFHFPLRTLRALRWSVAAGVQDPAEAWAEVQRNGPARGGTVPEDPAQAIRAAEEVGTPLTGAQLARMYGKSDRWGRQQIERARSGALHAVG